MRGSRNEADIKRDIEKDIPRNGAFGNFNGDSVDEVQRCSGRMMCPYCGQLMTPHRDWGNACMWRCWSYGCPNNIDETLKVDARSLDTYFPHDSGKIWSSFQPRRLL